MRVTTNTCCLDGAKEQRECQLCFFVSYTFLLQAEDVVTGACGDWQLAELRIQQSTGSDGCCCDWSLKPVFAGVKQE